MSFRNEFYLGREAFMIKSISKICFCCLLLWFFGSYLTLNFRVNCLDFCLIFCLSFQNQTSEWYPIAFVPIDQHAHQPSCLLLLLWRLFGCFLRLPLTIFWMLVHDTVILVLCSVMVGVCGDIGCDVRAGASVTSVLLLRLRRLDTADTSVNTWLSW